MGERKGEGDNGKGGRRKGNGKEKEKWANGKGRILCSCDFPPRKTRNVTHGNWIDVRLGGLAHAIRHDHRDLTARLVLAVSDRKPQVHRVAGTSVERRGRHRVFGRREIGVR